MDDWLKQVVEIGTALVTSNRRRGISEMTIALDSEIGMVRVTATKSNAAYMGQRFDAFPEIEITKIAPQGAATPTGARN